ncbi:MAG: methyltransferase domain-containing protein [Cyclobacteriaceae bacterium]|nr:methyltransferase domain-containing protein [Cyclobacteriaceae bacterium]
MSTSTRFTYGKTQIYTSPRMRKHPRLAKLIYTIFGYTSIGNWARANIFISLLQRLPLTRYNRILDLGAGLGEFTFMMAEALPAAKITALEILPERVAYLREVVDKVKFTNIEIADHKIELLPEHAAYDFIFSVDVFEHILEDEMPFEACFKKLKPGGHLLVKMPNIKQLTICPDSWFEEHNEWLEEEHIGQVYNLADLENRFKKAGFEIMYASYSDGWISRLAWELSYFTAKGGAVTQLIFLPLCKGLYYLEYAVNRKPTSGNSIQVIGIKPV